MRIFALGVVALVGCRGGSLHYLHPPSESDGRAGLGQLGIQLSDALRAEYRGQLAHAAPPIQLVPSDGSELALRGLSASVAIEGPLARTELHFTFHNAEAREREGRFSITLPADAVISRFAMKIDTAWREARIVTREKGREVYERFLHHRVDPALLERDLGNQFSARVYPIAANADKEIILAYEHRVSEQQPYVLALRGLPAIPTATVHVTNNGVAQTVEHRGEALADVVVPVAGGAAALAASGAFVARVTASVPPEPARLDRVLVLVDTSASRATVMGRQAEVVRELVATLPPTSDVTVAAFDHEVRELFHGAARDAAAAIPVLLEHGALGASNLSGALTRAAATGYPRVVIVGDGAPTLGEREPAKLASLVAGSPIQRIDAIQVGDALDRDTLAVVVAAGRVPGAILDGRDPARARHQLALALPAERPIKVAGAIASWPATTRGVAPGDPIWVFGLRASDDTRPLAVTVGDDTVHVTPRQDRDRDGLRRAVANAEIAQLLTGLATAGDRAMVVKRVAELALAHRLITPHTSMIVLESDADEQRMLDAVPTGRTFSAVLGASAGSQDDSYGVSFSGSTSIENHYIVEGINTTDAFTDSSGSVGLDRPQELIRRAKSSAFAFDSFPPTSAPDEPKYTAPYDGTLRDVMAAIHRGDRERALATATRWQLASPGELAALVALGEALEARGAGKLAARAYGSIADLYPSRSELLRAAAERLDRIPNARPFALDLYRRAAAERPDQPSSYRLLAYALARAGRGDEALDVLDEGTRHVSRASVLQLLGEDAAWIAAQLAAVNPARRDELARRVRGPLPTHAGLRIVLSWETDANDVDLHVRDRNNHHAFYRNPELRSGGRLRDDLTDGFGPEVFAIDDPGAFPYRLAVHYYNRGAMGLGLGTVQVIRRSAAGELAIDDRPFIIQNDNALVDLGKIER